MHESVTNPRPTPGLTLAICAALLMLFAALSWTAAMTKSATVDEPGHALSGWLMWHRGDFRLAPENPALWQLWAALPNLSRPLLMHPEGKTFADRSFDSQDGGEFVYHTLYQTPGNDGESLVRRSRAMMLLLGVLLGATIGWIAYRMGGSAAAVIAVGLFALDPNLLAHSAVVKSDVALALVMLALIAGIWQFGARATVGRGLIVAMLCGVAMNTKFSGLALLPITWMLCLIRALMPWPWACGAAWTGATVARSRSSRVGIALVLCAATVVVGIFITWASYGFRFRPAEATGVQMDMPAIRMQTIKRECGATLDPVRIPTEAELAAWNPTLLVHCIDWANDHRLMPQAWLAGLMYQHACMQTWPSYLMGRINQTGAWYYFPLAVLFKTPTATLLLLLLSPLAMLRHRRRWMREMAASPPGLWSAICLVLPVVVFAAAALGSHLNIGLRSILPVYPPVFVGLGILWGRMEPHRGRLSRLAVGTVAVMLITETLWAWPNYIAFFNLPTGGQRGGFALLGDSNLDWGQDLKALSQWQEQHPDRPIFLHYFGMADPAFFSPHFHNFELDANGQLISDIPVRGGVLAVSTNYLQGLYDHPKDEAFFRRLGQRPPDEIVGGSIYLFRNPWQ